MTINYFTLDSHREALLFGAVRGQRPGSDRGGREVPRAQLRGGLAVPRAARAPAADGVTRSGVAEQERGRRAQPSLRALPVPQAHHHG